MCYWYLCVCFCWVLLADFVLLIGVFDLWFVDLFVVVYVWCVIFAWWLFGALVLYFIYWWLMFWRVWVLLLVFRFLDLFCLLFCLLFRFVLAFDCGCLVVWLLMLWFLFLLFDYFCLFCIVDSLITGLLNCCYALFYDYVLIFACLCLFDWHLTLDLIWLIWIAGLLKGISIWLFLFDDCDFTVEVWPFIVGCCCLAWMFCFCLFLNWFVDCLLLNVILL